MKINPYLEVIIAAIIWSTSGVFVKFLKLNPAVLSFFRMAIPTVILTIYFIIIKRNVFKHNNKLVFLSSFLNSLRMFFYFVAFYYTSIGNAVIILYTWPIFVAIFSIFILKDYPDTVRIFALITAFAGIVIIYLNKEFSFKSNDFIGMSSMLISACIYSLSMIIFKFVSERYTKIEITYFQNFIGSFVFLPFIFIFKPFPSLEKLVILTVYSSLIGLIGFTMFFSALKKIKASVASNLSYIEILSGILLGVIFFKEKITWNMIAGGLLIILSVWIISKKQSAIKKNIGIK